MIDLRNQGPPITEARILDLERDLQAALCEDYRRFLAANNGGEPEPNIIEIEGLPGSPTDIPTFFGIDRPVASSDLFWNLALIRDRCPGRHVLPIACDSGGNLFCLKVSAGVATEAIYIDLDGSPRTPYEVAASFHDFMQKLRNWTI